MEDMLVELVTLGVMGVSGAAIWFNMSGVRRHRRRAGQAWQAVAEQLGLEYTPWTPISAPQVDGDYDGCPVRVRMQSAGRNWETTETMIEVKVPRQGHVPPLGFSRPGFVSRLSGMPSDDIKTGDPRFDEAVVVRGDPTWALGLLSSGNRRRIRMLIEDDKVDFAGGYLIWTHPTLITHVDRLSREIRSLVKAVKRLQLARPPVEALAQRALQDPTPGVRQTALKLLIGLHRGAPVTEKTLAAALNDEDPATRIWAARDAGPAARQPMLDLIKHARTPLPQRQEAIALLLKTFARAGLAADLRALIGPEHPADARCVALWGLGQLKHSPAQGEVLALLEAPPAQTPPKVQVAAIEALGRLGDQMALRAIRPFEKSRPSAVKAAAREAIARLEGRVESGASGGLSLANSDAQGGLSVVNSSGGLSPPEE